jgi:superfamily I DNA/RNA helicase
VGVIDFHHCNDGLGHQAQYIADTLIPHFLSEEIARSLGEIAVLYRTKSEGNVIADGITANDIEFIRIDGNAAYPKTPLTRWLEECAAWCTAVGKNEAPSLRAIIGEFLGFNRTLRSEADRIDATHKLVATLRNNMDGTVRLGTWISSLDTSCLRSHLTADPTMREELVALDRIIAATSEGKKLADWSASRFGGQGGSPNHLNLMTLHSSKGLEFDVVVLFGMDQGIIPSYREKSPDSKREPKRLFYVGITRARHEVHITYSGWRTTPWGARYNDGPSEFITELEDKLQD